MTILIYPSLLPGEPLERHEWVGTVAGFLASLGVDYAALEVQPITVRVNGQPCPVQAWATAVVAAADQVEIRPIPGGGWEWVVYAVVAAFAVYTYATMPKAKDRNNPTGQQLVTASGKANTAKLNSVVPELVGQYMRFPDYLTPPRRYFATEREQLLEMMLCIGPGSYEINPTQIKIGNTALQDLEGAEWRIFEPNASVTPGGMHEHWYPCPEVGGTSAGTAGLELSSSPAADVDPAVSPYSFDGVTIDAGAWPAGWGVGTEMSIGMALTYIAEDFKEGTAPSETMRTKLSGDFTGLSLEPGKDITVMTVDGDVQLRVDAIDGNGKITFLAQVLVAESWSFVPWHIPAGAHRLRFVLGGRRYRITSIQGTLITYEALFDNGAVVADWEGFPTAELAAGDVAWEVDPDTTYGSWSGPFIACPTSEVTNLIELDLFFPQGLTKMTDNGDLQKYSVPLELQWRDANNPTSAWVSERKTYESATLDQIGYTERVPIPGPSIRPEVRMRRVGVRETSTQIQDTVQWYGLRVQLPTATRYPRWTTMAVRIRGLGSIASSSENQINLVATRKLPTLQPDGSWSPAAPTRDIAAAVRYVARSIGYTDAQLDLTELQQLQALWAARGETVDHVFDETVVRDAIATCFAAGMAELTVDDGQIKPVRAGVRTAYEQSYSAQNMTGELTRTFTTARPDDNDGVQVEYIDAADSWTSKTVDCVLPGSEGVKLQKLKLDGVTDRTRAWRAGMRRAREIQYQRWTYEFSTELDALNSSYGSVIALVPDIPNYGQSAIVQTVVSEGAAVTLHLSEPLQWQAGVDHVVGWRLPTGMLAGPFAATAGPDAHTVIAAAVPPAQVPVVSLKREPPHAYFGTVTRWAFPALVRSIKPNGTDAVNVQAVNYDARLYADDDNTPAPA